MMLSIKLGGVDSIAVAHSFGLRSVGMYLLGIANTILNNREVPNYSSATEGSSCVRVVAQWLRGNNPARNDYLMMFSLMAQDDVAEFAIPGQVSHVIVMSHAGEHLCDTFHQGHGGRVRHRNGAVEYYYKSNGVETVHRMIYSSELGKFWDEHVTRRRPDLQFPRN